MASPSVDIQPQMQPAQHDRSWRAVVASAGSAILFVILSTFACPACLLAGWGILSGLGVGFAVVSSLQTPLQALLLGIAVVSSVVLWRRHRQWWPLLLVLGGIAAFAVDRMGIGCGEPAFVGVALLFGASSWSISVMMRKASWIRKGTAPIGAEAACCSPRCTEANRLAD
jgi:hypothetical protein